MKFNDLDFLIYSSHKTSTQSLLNILKFHNYKVRHCHYFSNLNLCLDDLHFDKSVFGLHD